MEAPRPHRHPRPCGRMRLLRVAVEDEMVEPERIHLVAQRLHRIRVFEPARLRRATGETFGADEGLAVDVRGGRGNLDRIGGSTHAPPEFAHARKSVVEGKSGYVRVDLGGRRIHKKKKKNI